MRGARALGAAQIHGWHCEGGLPVAGDGRDGHRQPGARRRERRDLLDGVSPPPEKIKAKYFEKFRGKGGAEPEEEVTTTKSGEAGPSSAVAVPGQACASPCYSDASDLALPPGLLRATPPRPLFSRTPIPVAGASTFTYHNRISYANLD